MTRLQTFTFRVDERERAMLDQLAAQLQRTQSDAVRLLIREAVNGLKSNSSHKEKANEPANTGR